MIIIDKKLARRKAIADALAKMSDEEILKIVKDYNDKNGFAQIYKNTEKNVAKLKELGYTVDSKDTFAFLTPNRYGGIQGANQIEELIDYGNELIPFIESNFTTYESDLHIGDNENDGVLDEEWLKAKWQKNDTLLERYKFIVSLANEIYQKGEIELAKKVKEIAEDYKAHHGIGKYNQAKGKILQLFKEFETNESATEISDERKQELKKYAVNEYNKISEKKISKYSNLPIEWQNRLTPYIESGREQTFEIKLKELVDNTRRPDKNLEQLKNEFYEIFGIQYNDTEALSKFAYRNDIDVKDFLQVIKSTFEYFKENEDSELLYDKILKIFKAIRRSPYQAVSLTREWNEIELSPEEKEKESKLERHKISSSFKEDYNKLINSNDEKTIEYFKEYYNNMKELVKAGKWTLEEFEREAKSLMEYCLIKSGAKEQKISKNKSSEKIEYDKNKLKEIYDYLNDRPKEVLEKLFDENDLTLKSKELKKLVEKLYEAFFNSTNSDSLLNFINTFDRTEAEEFFINMVRKDDKETEKLIKKIIGERSE